MAIGNEADQQAIDDGILPDHDMAELLANRSNPSGVLLHFILDPFGVGLRIGISHDGG